MSKPLREGKFVKGGVNDRPKTPRPEPPPKGTNQIEQAPNLEQMEGAKSSLLTFCMYYYQALRQAGHSMQESKEIVANEILSLYERYAKLGGLQFKPQVMVNPVKLLNEIIADVKSLGSSGKSIHIKLLDFKQLIEEDDVK